MKDASRRRFERFPIVHPKKDSEFRRLAGDWLSMPSRSEINSYSSRAKHTMITGSSRSDQNRDDEEPARTPESSLMPDDVRDILDADGLPRREVADPFLFPRLEDVGVALSVTKSALSSCNI
jgi:hypothetical protein